MYICIEYESFLPVGKKLKFFVLVIFATIALIGCTTKSDSIIIENQTNISYSDIDVQYFDIDVQCFDIDTPDIDLNLPRQISGISNVHRVQNVVKRTNSWHKNNFEFVKGNKVINVYVSNIIQKESLNNLHRFVKSASWLITLGKLII